MFLDGAKQSLKPALIPIHPPEQNDLLFSFFFSFPVIFGGIWWPLSQAQFSFLICFLLFHQEKRKMQQSEQTYENGSEYFTKT